MANQIITNDPPKIHNPSYSTPFYRVYNRMVSNKTVRAYNETRTSSNGKRWHIAN